MKIKFKSIVAAFFAVFLVNTSHAISQNQYDEFIVDARKGNYKPALSMLSQQGADNAQATYDYIVISNWASMPRESIRAYEAIQNKAALMPPDVYTTVAAAYRDTKQWAKSEKVYKKGQEAYPTHPNFVVGQIMVLADMGRSQEAIRIAQSAEKKWAMNADIQLAKAYAHQRMHDMSGALQFTTRAHNFAPDISYVTREYANALTQSNLAGPALAIAIGHPDLMTQSQMREIQANYAAELTRQATLPNRLESDRFLVADKAIAIYSQLIPEWSALGKDAEKDLTRIEIDYLLALHARNRMSDVIQSYQALIAKEVTLPNYAMGVVASAYLAMKKPAIASEIYKVHLAANSTSSASSEPEDQIGKFYSLIESENYDQAMRHIQHEQAQQAAWIWVKGQSERRPNDAKLEYAQTEAMGNFYSQDTDTAERQLSDFVNQAPNNSSLRSSLASVYRGKQWPRAAERELKMAETLTPRDINIETEQAYTALELQEWDQARLLLTDVYDRYPENFSVQKLKRAWEVHNKYELRVSGNRGISSNSPVSGDGDLGIDIAVYSEPINQNWRVFSGGGYSQGKFQDSTAYYRWARGGVEWRGRDLTLEAEISSNSYGFGVKPGFRVSAAYDLDDHWQVGVAGEINSRSTPLRALQNNISSNNLTAYARWRANEKREWALGVSLQKFSDHNNRFSVTLNGKERLYTAPRVKVDLELEASRSHNTIDNTPYFNPRADLSILPALRVTHRIYQHYESTLDQSVALAYGRYFQKNFRSGPILSISYGLRFRTDDVFDIGATVTSLKRPYDGESEREFRFLLDMNYRF